MLEIKRIREGCFLAKAGEESVLLGCPPDTIKILENQGETLPEIIVIPEDLYQGGAMQADLEFPFFKSVFFLGRYFKNIKLKIVGAAQNLARVKQLLNLAVFGPTDDMQRTFRVRQEEIDEQRKIADYLAFKDRSEIVPLEKMVEFIPYKNGQVTVGSFTFFDRGDNLVDIEASGESEPVDLNIYEKQNPVFQPKIDPKFKLARPTFGIMAISECTSGFDKKGSTSGFVNSINSEFYTIDGVPGMKPTLNAFGISTSEIRGSILSHAHGDHSTIYDMMLNGRRARVITTLQVYVCLVLKIAWTIDWPVEKVMSMIDFVEVKLNEKFNFYGAEFTFFRVAHTVPTVGFEEIMSGKRFVYSGDTVWGKRLREMLDNNVITQKLFQAIDTVPREKSDLTIMDAAGGLIHSDVKDLDTEIELAQKTRTCVTHISSLPEGVTGLSLAYPGRQWVLIPSKKIDLGDYNGVMNAPILSGINYEWKNAIISQGSIENIHRGRKVLKKGQAGKDFYIILSGTFDVLSGENELITRLGAGDFFGEISLMDNVPCTATIKAASNSKLLRLPANIFLALIESTTLKHELRQIHQVRPTLFNCGLTKELPAHVVNQLIAKMKQREYKKNEVVIKQGEIGEDIFFVVDGRLSVLVEPDGMFGKQIAKLYRNQFFGEMAAFGNGVRTATVKADKDTTLLAISKEDFKAITSEVPMLMYYFGKLVEERKK
jgi:CRP-like cAMP-binding protein